MKHAIKLSFFLVFILSAGLGFSSQAKITKNIKPKFYSVSLTLSWEKEDQGEWTVIYNGLNKAFIHRAMLSVPHPTHYGQEGGSVTESPYEDVKVRPDIIHYSTPNYYFRNVALKEGPIELAEIQCTTMPCTEDTRNFAAKLYDGKIIHYRFRLQDYVLRYEEDDNSCHIYYTAPHQKEILLDNIVDPVSGDSPGLFCSARSKSFVAHIDLIGDFNGDAIPDIAFSGSDDIGSWDHVLLSSLRKPSQPFGALFTDYTKGE